MTGDTFANGCARADAVRAKADNQGSKNKDKERIVDKLIKIAIDQSEGDHPRAGGLFHAPDSIGYADISHHHRRETWPIRSRGFRQWLVRVYYEVNGTAPNSEAIQTAKPARSSTDPNARSSSAPARIAASSTSTW